MLFQFSEQPEEVHTNLLRNVRTRGTTIRDEDRRGKTAAELKNAVFWDVTPCGSC
jgi:hypothetical protein